MSAADDSSSNCVDQSRLTIAIFGAIFCTLLLCTGFALAIWYLVRNHELGRLIWDKAGTDDKPTECASHSVPEIMTTNMDKHSQPIAYGMARTHVTLEMDEIPRQKILANNLSKQTEINFTDAKNARNNQQKHMQDQEDKGNKLEEQTESNEIKKGGNTDDNDINSPPLTTDKEFVAIMDKSVDEGGNAVRHEKATSHDSVASICGMPKNEQLREMLSTEQFDSLVANRRRLEQERRHLRELGVI